MFFGITGPWSVRWGGYGERVHLGIVGYDFPLEVLEPWIHRGCGFLAEAGALVSVQEALDLIPVLLNLASIFCRGIATEPG